MIAVRGSFEKSVAKVSNEETAKSREIFAPKR